MFSALMIVCIASMTAHDSKSSLRRDVLVDWDHDRDAKRDGIVVVVKQAEKQESQKSQMSQMSHNQQNNGALERHNCCSMFTAQTSPSTTFEQYRHGITTRMLVEHATLARYMQTLLTCNALRGRNLHHLMNASLATTPEMDIACCQRYQTRLGHEAYR